MSIETEPSLLIHRRTKIVATVGPASSSEDVITALIEAGVNVFRINLSHGSHAAHGAAIELIRQVAARLATPTAILADLCGPKIRTGKFRDGGVELVAGNRVIVTTADVLGDAQFIPSQYPALPQDVAPGNRILLNDGAVELRVLEVRGQEVDCLVVAGGPVGDHKGINLPGTTVSAPSLTDKDRKDAVFALAAGVDSIALSFVRNGDDITALRVIVDAAGSKAGIIAKIEKPEALANSEDIIARADGVVAYQLAVVTDDAAMGMTEVVRGDDLFESTPRQLALFHALGAAPPRYVHVPLMLGPDGQRLAKRHGATSLAELRDGGRTPEAVVGILAHSLGVTPTAAPLSARELSRSIDPAALHARPPFTPPPIAT